MVGIYCVTYHGTVCIINVHFIIVLGAFGLGGVVKIFFYYESEYLNKNFFNLEQVEVLLVIVLVVMGMFVMGPC